MKLSEICEIFPNVRLVRNGIFDTIGFPGIKNIENMLVFMRDVNYFQEIISNKNISAVISLPEFESGLKDDAKFGIILSDEPDKTFYQMHNYLYRETDFYNRDNAKTSIGEKCKIHPSAVIADMNVTIGNNVIIEAGAVVMESVTIGNNCVIGANSTIGSRGYQYFKNNNDIFHIEHIGGVIIEDNVEIFSGSCVACGLVTPTYISKNCKIDSQVQIGHSTYLDERVLVTAGVTVGGSVHIGKHVWIGMNASIAQSVYIGDDAFICMGAVVTRDVDAGQKVSGNFAIEHKKQVEFIKRISQ